MSYVPVLLEPDERVQAINLVTDAVIKGLSLEPECSLSALRVSANREANVDVGDDNDGSYFSVRFGNPVFDFLVQMGPTTFRIAKVSSTLQNLVLTTPLLAEITRQLFAAGPAHGFAAAGINLNIYRSNFSWEHRLVLGRHLADESEATNVEVLGRLARLAPAAGGDSALEAFGTEGIVRGDVSLGFNRIIAGRRRQVWLNYEGPYNVTRKDVDMRVTYRLEDPNAPIQSIEDLVDFRTPFLEFYRDLVLKTLYRDLFKDIEVTGRP